MEILNTWQSKSDKKVYFAVGEDECLFKLGDYRIFKQFKDCYLYTFKNVAINQLAGLNKEHLTALFEDKRPENQSGFLFDRAKESLQRGLALID